jgi:hypothetical protein
LKRHFVVFPSVWLPGDRCAARQCPKLSRVGSFFLSPTPSVTPVTVPVTVRDMWGAVTGGGAPGKRFAFPGPARDGVSNANATVTVSNAATRVRKRRAISTCSAVLIRRISVPFVTVTTSNAIVLCSNANAASVGGIIRRRANMTRRTCRHSVYPILWVPESPRAVSSEQAGASRPVRLATPAVVFIPPGTIITGHRHRRHR